MRQLGFLIPLAVALFFAFGEKEGYPGNRDRFAVVYTNDTSGFLEPCGCASGLLGGLARRATLLRNLRARYPSLLVILDSGNVSNDKARLDVILESMAQMGYQGVGMGLFEILLAPSFIPSAQKKRLRLLSALPPPGEFSHYLLEQWIAAVGQWKIGVLGLSPSDQFDAEVLYARLQKLLPGLRSQADFVIVLSQLGLQQDQQVAQWQQDRGWIDFIIGNREASQLQNPLIFNRTALLPTSEYGKQLGFIEFTSDDQEFQWEWKQLPVGESYEPDSRVQELIETYRRTESEALRDISLRQEEMRGEAGLVPGDFVEDFINAEGCKECHESAYLLWYQHKHARAPTTLREKNRLVPECLQCHSETFRRTGQFLWKEDLIDGVQCSTCHGDGVLHRLQAGRGPITRSVEEKFCRSCHNTAHHPHFDFPSALESIRHW